MILNGNENKEASAICFELRVPMKKNKEIFWKVPSKIYGSNSIMEKTKTFFGLSIFPNIITEQCDSPPDEILAALIFVHCLASLPAGH